METIAKTKNAKLYTTKGWGWHVDNYLRKTEAGQPVSRNFGFEGEPEARKYYNFVNTKAALKPAIIDFIIKPVTGFTSWHMGFECHVEGVKTVEASCPNGDGYKYARLQNAAPVMLDALKQVNAVLDLCLEQGTLNEDFVADLKCVTNKAILKASK